MHSSMCLLIKLLPLRSLSLLLAMFNHQSHTSALSPPLPCNPSARLQGNTYYTMRYGPRENIRVRPYFMLLDDLFFFPNTVSPVLPPHTYINCKSKSNASTKLVLWFVTHHAQKMNNGVRFPFVWCSLLFFFNRQKQDAPTNNTHFPFPFTHYLYICLF